MIDLYRGYVAISLKILGVIFYLDGQSGTQIPTLILAFFADMDRNCNTFLQTFMQMLRKLTLWS